MKVMYRGKAILLGLAICAFAPALSANAATMKECAAQWQQMKAAKTTGGKTYKEFSKECMSGTPAAPAAAATTAKPAAAAPATATTAAKPATTTTSAKPVSPGREAMYERERACGKEWKEAKAAGKTNGMKWPQFWSACDKRMKAAGK